MRQLLLAVLLLMPLPALAAGKTVAGWIAWYTEDRKFNSALEDWADLPDDGVLYLVIYFEEKSPGGVRYKRTLSGYDYYFRAADHEGRVFYAANNDPPDETARRYPGASIKRGKWTSDADMLRVEAEARRTTWSDD